MKELRPMKIMSSVFWPPGTNFLRTGSETWERCPVTTVLRTTRARRVSSNCSWKHSPYTLLAQSGHTPSQVAITWYKGMQMLSIHSSCNRGSSSFRFRSKIAWSGGGGPCFITAQNFTNALSNSFPQWSNFSNWTLHKLQPIFIRTFFSLYMMRNKVFSPFLWDL